MSGTSTIQPLLEKVLGTDVSVRELERAAARLRLHDASDAERERVRLL
jgi:hypothetical protein